MIIDPKKIGILDDFKKYIPKHLVIILMRMLEVFIVFITFLIGMIILIDNKIFISENSKYIIFFWLLIMVVLIRFVINQLKGVSLGLFIFGIRYVDLSTRQYITKETYETFWWHQFLHNFRLSGWGEMLEFFENRYSQKKVMRDMGIIYVYKKDFDRYLKDQSKETL